MGSMGVWTRTGMLTTMDKAMASLLYKPNSGCGDDVLYLIYLL